jgi:hypothetical protein
MMVRHRVSWLVALAVSAALTSSATAIEYTKLLPADTEFITSINVRQILDAPLVKNTGLDQAKDALEQLLQGDEEIRGYVKSLGIDVFHDVHRITAAGPASKESDKGVIIIEGKFSPEKFAKTAAEVSRRRGDYLKVGKIGNRELWEIPVPQQPGKTLFVTLADGQTLVAAMSKASLRDMLAQADGKKVELKKGMREVIDGVDPKASLYFAALSDALIQAIQEGLKDATVPNAGKVSDMATELKKKLNALSGSIAIGDDLKFQVALSTKEAKVAREMAQMVTMAQGVGILALNQAAQNNEQLTPLIEVVQNIRAAPKGNIVIIRGGISAETINRLKKGN